MIKNLYYFYVKKKKKEKREGRVTKWEPFDEKVNKLWGEKTKSEKGKDTTACISAPRSGRWGHMECFVMMDEACGWKSAHNFNIIIFLRLARAHIALQTWKPRNKPRLRVSFWLRPFISSAEIAASSLPRLSSWHVPCFYLPRNL